MVQHLHFAVDGLALGVDDARLFTVEIIDDLLDLFAGLGRAGDVQLVALRHRAVVHYLCVDGEVFLSRVSVPFRGSTGFLSLARSSVEKKTHGPAFGAALPDRQK